jgi:hypothetical protein
VGKRQGGLKIWYCLSFPFWFWLFVVWWVNEVGGRDIRRRRHRRRRRRCVSVG